MSGKRGRWILASVAGAALLAAVDAMVEKHLTQAQWRAFLHQERSRRSARERPEFLTWILDDASEQDAAAVLTELPPPARLVYRRVLRPRYDAHHRWQISGAVTAE